MGMGPMKSCYTNYSEEAKDKNPDPSKFKIMKRYNGMYNKQLYDIFVVKYENCTAYEGDKILVFKGTRNDIANTMYLDPHFSKRMDSPLIRVNPNQEGWDFLYSLFNFKR